MAISVYYYGKIKQKYLLEGLNEYKEKIGHFVPIDLREIKDNPKYLSREQKLIKLPIDQKIVSKAFFIALHERGKSFDSHQFADYIQNIHKDVIFLIGPPAGIDTRILKDFQISLSLSNMTLNHEHVLLILFEQLYRAYTILKNIPYHK